MKKIFIPLITLLAIGFAAPSHSRWGETFSNSSNNGGSMFSEDSDNYWLNRFRGYKKYHINFYSENMINKGRSEETRTVNVHEYKRGVAVTARLGQRMYDSTTYTVTKKTGGEQYKAATEGLFYNAQNEIKIKNGEIFTPFGEVKINGQYYILFELPDSPYVVMADSKGQFLDALGMVENGYLYISKDITIIRPRDFHVVEYDGVEETSGDAKLNFEIQYGGLQNNQIVFIIRTGENDTEGLRQTVPADQQIIRVNNIDFEIIHVSSDYIEYVILN